jgi:hypothetical protein
MRALRLHAVMPVLVDAAIEVLQVRIRREQPFDDFQLMTSSAPTV